MWPNLINAIKMYDYNLVQINIFMLQQAGTPNENIAKLIFMELNNAWSTFENDASQQNLFS